jgi:polyhydroxyalkanoate synthesis regulator phasin
MSGKLDELDWVQIIVNYGELSDSIEKETINRRRDTLNILSTIAGVEDRFADFINVLEERIDELEADHNKPSFQTDLEALTEKVDGTEEHLKNLQYQDYVVSQYPTIKALTENIEGQELRLIDLENLVDQHLRPQLREQPITFGISNSGPVPNDGKAKLSKDELVEKYTSKIIEALSVTDGYGSAINSILSDFYDKVKED